jgi:hypothetical protein
MQKEVFFCCKVQYIPALPSPVDTFLAFFSIFFVVKALFYRVPLNMA